MSELRVEVGMFLVKKDRKNCLSCISIKGNKGKFQFQASLKNANPYYAGSDAAAQQKLHHQRRSFPTTLLSLSLFPFCIQLCHISSLKLKVKDLK